jgi:hypothetical protein
VWFDRENMPSRALTFLHEIREAINEHDRLVLVFGPGALNSEYVEAQWRHALEMGRPVNPVLWLGDYPDMPDELKLLDALDLRDDARYPVRIGNARAPALRARPADGQAGGRAVAAAALPAVAEGVDDFACDSVGTQELPKEGGACPTYHLRAVRK